MDMADMSVNARNDRQKLELQKLNRAVKRLKWKVAYHRKRNRVLAETIADLMVTRLADQQTIRNLQRLIRDAALDEVQV